MAIGWGCPHYYVCVQSRDDEMAEEIEICDAEDKDEDPESPYKGVQLDLAPSEIKPYSRYIYLNYISLLKYNLRVICSMFILGGILMFYHFKQAKI